jgi:hypothetical protein
MYAYDLINCITNSTNQNVREFWKFYHGPGIKSVMLGNPSTTTYLRFNDLLTRCPNLTVELFDMSLPQNTTIFKSGTLVSRHNVTNVTVNVRIIKFLSLRLASPLDFHKTKLEHCRTFASSRRYLSVIHMETMEKNLFHDIELLFLHTLKLVY